MSGIRSGSVAVFPSPDALPENARRLFDTADTIFSTSPWWQIVLAHATPPSTNVQFVVCSVDGVAVGLFPMRGNGTEALTTPYTCLYAPLIDAGADPVRVFATFGRFCRERGVTRLDCLPAEWSRWDAMEQGLRSSGLRLLRFAHFGNWYEDVGDLDWSGWLSRRPGALRETIRRRLRRAERLAWAVFTLIDGVAGLEEGIAAFELVYAKSWKQPEPFPDFNAAFMRAMAPLGVLRLGVWSIDGMPVAAQYWIVEGGKATVLKLAHDEAFKEHSPGTVLTATILRHLLDVERIGEIDFGRGDDQYKRDWVGQRRERLGVLIVDPRHPSGWIALIRHALGRVRQRLRSGFEPA